MSDTKEDKKAQKKALRKEKKLERKREKAAKKAEKKKDSNWISALLKLSFFVITFFAVILTVMANMGGNSETLRESLESFIASSVGGRPASIDNLVNVSFFPVLGVDMEDLEVKATPESRENVIVADKIRAYMTFWGVIMKQTTLSALLIENMRVQRGILGYKRFSIEKMFIDHDKGTKQATIIGYGEMEKYDWRLKLDVDVYGSVGSFRYHIGKKRPMEIEMDDLRFKTILSEKISDYVKLDQMSIGMPETIVKGELSLSLLEGGILKVRGRLISGEEISIYKPNLLIDFSQNPTKISGTVESEKLYASNWQDEKSPAALFNYMHEMFDIENIADDGLATPAQKENDTGFSDKTYACEYDLDVTVNIKSYVDQEGEEHEDVAFKMKQDKKTLSFEAENIGLESFEKPCEDIAILNLRKED